MKPEKIVKNFRDVGKSVNQISGKFIFPEQLLYRGGALTNVFTHDEILNIPTILNLRTGKDNPQFNCQYLHIPAENKIENYDTNNGRIRKWINKVIAKLIEPSISFPVLIHCTSGKDRTGVITATILKILAISDEIIIKEYLLSEGVKDFRHIKRALLGISDINQYIKGDNALLLQKKLQLFQSLKTK